MTTKKFLLQEKDIPTAWYNIVADMKNKPMPILNPKTKQPFSSGNEYDRCLDRNPGRGARIV